MAKNFRPLSSNPSESAGLSPPPKYATSYSDGLRFRDGFTPNQDFVISAHPHSKNLYVATGGSFHGWKFLPILGKYVVKLLDGELNESLVKRWAWDRRQEGAAHETVRPRRELNNLNVMVD
jgi:hypothetical protein